MQSHSEVEQQEPCPLPKLPWRRSITARLLITYVGGWLIAAGLFLGIGGWALRSGGSIMSHGPDRAAQALTEQVHFTDTGEPRLDPLPEQLQWIFISSPQDASFRIVDAAGRTLLWSSEGAREAWERANGQNTAIPFHGAAKLDGVGVHTATRFLASPDGRDMWLQVAVSDRLAAMRHEELGHAFEATLVLAALVSIGLLGLVLLLVLQRVIAPLQRISREAQRVHPREPWHRLGYDGLPTEILPLVRSFNQALDRLEDGAERQQRFLADAAHELKTPLALLRAHIETGDGDRQTLLEDIDLMSRQVQQLLLLAEVSEPRAYQDEPIDANKVANDVVAFLAPLATRCEVDLLTTGRTLADLRGDQGALFVLLKNLVENAINVAPPKTLVTLTLADGQITVRDEGPGIPAQYLTRLFDRFWRVPGSRYGGAGLGLAICMEVATIHGWQLAARNREADRQGRTGAEFVLAFAPA